MENSKCVHNLGWKLQGDKPFGICKDRCERNTKSDYRELGFEDKTGFSWRIVCSNVALL
jgi:hypothetical protein